MCIVGVLLLGHVGLNENRPVCKHCKTQDEDEDNCVMGQPFGTKAVSHFSLNCALTLFIL